MNMKKHRLIILALIICLIQAFLSGCGSFVDLTEDESRQIVNYSTNVLNDHNTEVKGSLKDLTKTDLRDIVIKDDPGLIKEIEEAKQQALAQEEQRINPTKEASPNENGGGEEGEKSGGNDGVLTREEAELSSVLGLQDFSVEYGGYDLLDSYPQEESEDMLFSIEPATADDELLVLYFYITNKTGEEKECNILELEPKFRFKFSGKTNSFMTTLLLDDLSTFVSPIEAQGRSRAVLVAEISREKAETLSNLTLLVTMGEETTEVLLES